MDSAVSSVLDAFTWSRYRPLRLPVAQAYADTVTDIPNEHQTGRRGSAAVITDARMGTTEEMTSRIRRYTITMAFRTACFISMIFVNGPFRWVLFGCAVALPYVAVVMANQAKQRTKPGRVEPVEPAERPQLTVGEPTEVISGDADDASSAGGSGSRDKRVA
jgi:hypothetical protein